MKTERTEGIVTNILPFQDAHLIFTVFSPDLGLVKFLCKHARSGRKNTTESLAPFTRAEWIYRPSSSELLLCQENSPLEAHLSLRKSLPVLQAAGSLIQVVQATQWPGKPTPLLYHLLLSYLHHLPEFPDPALLVASYKLKLLRHEGLWIPKPEEDLLLLLTFSRSIQDLSHAAPLSGEILEKIDRLYTEFLE